ncbi:MAG: tRNA (adenosine(37)-N6)-threonylcarbamoyltransferase complex dimerization subunit type 1 TsaB [Devosiaceae bacterium]
MNAHGSEPIQGNQAPILLTLDTAGPACQVVVAAGASVLAQISTPMLRGHGEALVPMVEEALDQAGLTYESLDRIGVTIGPGSFTGMRVALAAARGFSATLNIPVIGIGTLQALAVTDVLESKSTAVRCVAIDARNGLVYGQRFKPDGSPMEDPAVMADLVFSTSVPEGARLVGSATPVIAALVRAANKSAILGTIHAVPSAQALVNLASVGDPKEKPKPLYLKAADAIAAQPAGLRA